MTRMASPAPPQPASRKAPRTRPGAAAWQAQARTDSPLGGILLAATARGLGGLWFDGQKDHPGALNAPVDASHPWIAQALVQLKAYWRGELQHFDLPLDLHGTPFQQAVWQALVALPHGRVCSYQDLADGIGRPRATRAVGAAVGRNPVSVIVPCHRVIGRDGSLTGYAGGLPRKQALLTLEGRQDLLAAT